MRLGSLIVFCLFALISLGIGCAAARDAQVSDVSVRSDAVDATQQIESDEVVDISTIAPVTEPEDKAIEIEVVDDTAVVGVIEPVVTRTLSAKNFSFSPTTIVVPAGRQIEITVDQVEGEHTFVAEELGIDEELAVGKVIAFTSPEVPGRYAFYCGIGPHRGLGMEGVIVVE